LATKLRGYKRANESANDAANFYKDQVDRNLADLNKQVETNRLQSAADKAEIEELKTEIEKLKAENTALKQAESEKPSDSGGNKTPGLFDHHSKGPTSTSPEKLMAVIDKQSFNLVEMKKKLAAAEEHVTSLRREMQQVRTPETVVATKAGQCFHAHGCTHLQHGREPRAFVELRKCKDCLP
jgi:cell division protein FtsB